MSEVVDYETALNEFDRVMRARMLNTDTDQMEKVELAQFEEGRDKFVELVQSGALTCGDDGDVTYSAMSPKSPSAPIKFGEITGATYAAGDREEGGVGKTIAMIGQATGKPVAIIRKMHQIDFLNLKTLVQLFLA